MKKPFKIISFGAKPKSNIVRIDSNKAALMGKKTAVKLKTLLKVVLDEPK